MDNFYQKVKDAQDQDSIEGLIEEIYSSDKNNPLCNFDVNVIPESVPINDEIAYLARKIALEIPSEKKEYWQNYWFRCCISDKCNYIFKILYSKNVDREDDLKKICNLQSELCTSLANENMKQSYFDLSIDYFLKRYNWLGASQICFKAPNKIKNVPKLIIPRMLAATLVGFVAIATSNEIWEFAVTQQSYLLHYSIALICASGLYSLYECHKITQGTLSFLRLLSRVFFVLIIGILLSLVLSYIFTLLGLFTTAHIPETSIICKNRVLFYSTLALFIGILIQLLWEEKTVAEPL
jgi:hypothetical protein